MQSATVDAAAEASSTKITSARTSAHGVVVCEVVAVDVREVVPVVVVGDVVGVVVSHDGSIAKNVAAISGQTSLAFAIMSLLLWLGAIACSTS